MIADGAWLNGAQISNEAKLGEMLGVSRITMRHALRNMEEWGLLRREPGAALSSGILRSSPARVDRRV